MLVNIYTCVFEVMLQLRWYYIKEYNWFIKDNIQQTKLIFKDNLPILPEIKKTKSVMCLASQKGKLTCFVGGRRLFSSQRRKASRRKTKKESSFFSLSLFSVSLAQHLFLYTCMDQPDPRAETDFWSLVDE